MKTYDKGNLIYRITSLIPKGKVLRYRDLATFSNLRSPRIVGSILHANPNPKGIPCHRVVNSQGLVAANFAFGGALTHRKLLEKEGVGFKSGKVLLKEFLWCPSKVLVKFFNLLAEYGEPGPWPWFKSEDPHTVDEIVIGSVLTQNTNWRNVDLALINLRREKFNTIQSIYKLGKNDTAKLEKLIRPSGFYRQKAQKLIRLVEFIIEDNKGLKNLLSKTISDARDRLLSLSGIGPETADTILLFALNKPTFVIDAYTKRFVSKFNLSKDFSYNNLKGYFEENLPKDIGVYKDYHALIIKWGKTNKPQR